MPDPIETVVADPRTDTARRILRGVATVQRLVGNLERARDALLADYVLVRDNEPTDPADPDSTIFDNPADRQWVIARLLEAKGVVDDFAASLVPPP